MFMLFAGGLFGNSAGDVRFYQVIVPFLAPLCQFPLFPYGSCGRWASFVRAVGHRGGCQKLLVLMPHCFMRFKVVSLLTDAKAT
jgi:hypothetical protein